MNEQYGFYVDTSRCIKCWACQVTCKQWNNIKAGDTTRRFLVENDEGVFPDVKRVFVTTACNHCEEPACAENCPVGAITKRAEDGLVVVDRNVCIGCQTCARVCPFGIPQYRAEDGLMDKCDGCVTCGKTPEDEPHCVATCPTKALHFGPLSEMAEMAAEKGGKRMEGATLPSTYVY